MGKFNLKLGLTKNKSGHVAYKMTLKEKLVTEVLTSLFNEKKFYGDNSEDILKDVRQAIEEDPKFVANLCIYVRKEFHLRSISHVLVSELAKSNKGKPYVREVVNNIVERVDDMNEILACYINNYGKPIPNSLKKGLADKFLTFDEYSLAKYNRQGAIKLKDILCLTHPKPKNKDQEHLFKRVLEDKLETPITWETQLSAHGNTKETWEYLIQNGKLGYMAMLRNLRNIAKVQPNNIDKVYDIISDENRVLKSKQLPFRYYTAYKALKNEGFISSKPYSSLEKAIKASTKNIETLKGTTLIAADVSGSMNSSLSRNGDTTCGEIAILLMAMANHICEDAITVTFDFKLESVPMASEGGIITNANSVRVTGGGTNLGLPIQYLLNNNVKVDRIIILSDNEINHGYDRVCQNLIESYRKKINKDVWVHAIDLMGYGTQQFKGPKTNIIAGWNEKVLDFIPKAEQGTDTLQKSIESYHFK
ncbi:TROVE domain-containing protein [Clostridium cavendishii DSM 21758]|uniref:TROVE domain-containing protein n=1 Tax=Clostridium cavendishii DSM 21758 TaxID=1121302 RepID=A0A1M6IQX7_9CLOT|nr:TROVE domain-containing protein [Clostridium cavendishii]SHJ36739.1 TROVE domain-containing protein [Clostridium cavendishii DSM 21758]